MEKHNTQKNASLQLEEHDPLEGMGAAVWMIVSFAVAVLLVLTMIVPSRVQSSKVNPFRPAGSAETAVTKAR